MTREELINNIVFCSPKWTYTTLNKIEMYVKQAYNDDEAQLIAKDELIDRDWESYCKELCEEISSLKKSIGERDYEYFNNLKDKNEEIATAKMRHKLEHDRYLITEAIIKEKDEEIERLEKALVSALKKDG